MNTEVFDDHIIENDVCLLKFTIGCHIKQPSPSNILIYNCFINVIQNLFCTRPIKIIKDVQVTFYMPFNYILLYSLLTWVTYFPFNPVSSSLFGVSITNN